MVDHLKRNVCSDLFVRLTLYVETKSEPYPSPSPSLVKQIPLSLNTDKKLQLMTVHMKKYR